MFPAYSIKQNAATEVPIPFFLIRGNAWIDLLLFIFNNLFIIFILYWFTSLFPTAMNKNKSHDSSSLKQDRNIHWIRRVPNQNPFPFSNRQHKQKSILYIYWYRINCKSNEIFIFFPSNSICKSNVLRSKTCNKIKSCCVWRQMKN